MGKTQGFCKFPGSFRKSRLKCVCDLVADLPDQDGFQIRVPVSCIHCPPSRNPQFPEPGSNRRDDKECQGDKDSRSSDTSHQIGLAPLWKQKCRRKQAQYSDPMSFR